MKEKVDHPVIDELKGKIDLSLVDELKGKVDLDIIDDLKEKISLKFLPGSKSKVHPGQAGKFTEKVDSAPVPKIDEKADISKIREACLELLNKIRKTGLGSNDVKMNEYFKDNFDKIKDNNDDKDFLIKLARDLAKMYASVNTNEVVQVKLMIKKLLQRSRGWFGTKGLVEKARKVTEAFSHTPLEERGRVISERKANAVQKTLATHRFFNKNKPQLPMKGDEIDFKKAAKSYKKIKKAVCYMP